MIMQPKTPNPLGLLVALLVPLAFGSGCVATTPRFEAIPETTTPTSPPAVPERPVRLLVGHYEKGQGRELYRAIVDEMETDPHFEVVKLEAGEPLDTTSFDYRLDLDFAVAGDGNAANFLRCFPGFVVLAPQWSPLTWDCVLETRVGIQRLSSDELVEFERGDGVEMAYTSAGYSFAAHSGWWVLLFTPMAAPPLITGVVAVFDDADEGRFFEYFAPSDAGRDWTTKVIGEVLTRIAGLESGAPRAEVSAHPAPGR